MITAKNHFIRNTYDWNGAKYETQAVNAEARRIMIKTFTVQQCRETLSYFDTTHIGLQYTVRKALEARLSRFPEEATV